MLKLVVHKVSLMFKRLILVPAEAVSSTHQTRASCTQWIERGVRWPRVAHIAVFLSDTKL